MNKQILVYPSSFQDFNQYALRINDIEKLKAEEEYNLAYQLYYNNDLEAAKKLIWHNMYLVIYAAKKFSGYNLSLMDLAQEGTIGLMKAVKKFNPEQGVRLATYAIHWVEAEIKSFVIANYKIVKVGSTKAMKKLFFGYKKTLRKIGVQSNISLTNEDIINHIAKKNKTSSDEVKQIIQYFEGEVDSYDEQDNSSILNLENMPSIEKENESILNQEKINIFKDSLGILNEKQKDVIFKRYLADKPNTLKELSVYHNVSLERVRQIENEAICKLKNHIKENYKI